MFIVQNVLRLLLLRHASELGDEVVQSAVQLALGYGVGAVWINRILGMTTGTLRTRQVGHLIF